MQTAQDLIDDLLRLTPAQRQRPVRLVLDGADASDIGVACNGPEVVLSVSRDVADVPDETSDPFPLGVTCPECDKEFRVTADGEAV